MTDIIDLIDNGCDLKFALTDHRYESPCLQNLIGDRFKINLIKKFRSIEIEKNLNFYKIKKNSKMVIWLIGLSASGKTTLGREIYNQWKSTEPNTVFIDGDEIRDIFKQDQEENSHTIDGRRKNAERICELCAWLDRQSINVVCSILSIFENSQEWNRKNYSKYFEVFISVPMDTLLKRETKNLYKLANLEK